MSSSSGFVVVIILWAQLRVDAIPRCRNYENGRILCTAGATDYKLQEGFVSGDDDARSITLRECGLIGIGQNSLKDLPMLEYLDLSVNKLSIIEENSFDGLNKLIHLNLSYNMITEITGYEFSKASNIEVLDLRGNQLKTFRKGYLKKLDYLDLSHNLLASHSLLNTFLDNNYLGFLDLTGNEMKLMPVNFFATARNLETLRLDSCSLTNVPNLRFNHLYTIKYLSLSSNKLTSISNIETFIYLKKLETLNLADNEIEFIVERVFLLSTYLKYIILKNNKLKVIPEALFQILPNLINLDLSYNLLDHIPVDTFLSTPLKQLNLAGNRFTYLLHNFLSQLRNIQVNIEKFYFYHNPWQCACFLDILREVKKYNIEYNSTIYDGGRPVCVIAGELKCKRQPIVN